MHSIRIVFVIRIDFSVCSYKIQQFDNAIYVGIL